MEPIRTDLQYFEPTHTIHTSFTERTDAIVPDAEPDIGRILCAYASVSVKDELPQNDRILLSGTVSAVVLFRPDGQDTIRFLQISRRHRAFCPKVPALCAVRSLMCRLLRSTPARSA